MNRSDLIPTFLTNIQVFVHSSINVCFKDDAEEEETTASVEIITAGGLRTM